MRFVHTSDWQLGLRRYYFDEDAQARFAADRFEAVRRLGELAREAAADAVLVAGDVFESNRIDGRTLRRGLDAMGEAGVPVLLLPGNHDPLDAGSLYRSRAFAEARPDNVRVLDGEEGPVACGDGEVVAAPWPGKRPQGDLVAGLAARLEPSPDRPRVCVAHGAVDSLSPDRHDPAAISLAAAEEAIAARRFHYLALGDRHSATSLGERVRYSGSPEPTDFGEERPGRALLVELSAESCRVEEHAIGRWRFVAQSFHLTGDADLERLDAWLEELPDKPRTVLRLALEGGLPLHARARLDELLAVQRERFASLEERATGGGLTVLPDRLDRDALELSGIAARVFEELRGEATGEGEPAAAARDALTLLYRLARAET